MAGQLHIFKICNNLLVVFKIKICHNLTDPRSADISCNDGTVSGWNLKMEVKNMKGKLNKFMAVALAVMIGTGGSFQWAAASEVTSQTEADLLTGESVQAGDEGAAADTKTDADDGAGTAGTEKNSENETKTSETEDENSEICHRKCFGK